MDASAAALLGSVEVEVRDRAARRVAERLKLPDDLHGLDQYRRECARKKASAESRLKQTLQSQLEDVKRGLELLALANEGVREVKDDVASAEDAYEACKELGDYVAEAARLSQERNELKVTMEQLDRVFGVPETVEAIKELFAEANPNLLEAHEMMRGMEVARDHLMAQLETQAKTKRSATAAVTSYFQGLVECEDLLLSAFEPAYNPVLMVQRNPEGLVTVLRIIEREEAREAQGTRSATKLTKLKTMYYEKVEKAIQSRFADRLGSCESVDAFLKGVEGFYFQDLLVAKDDLPSRFPPNEGIFQFFLSQYHNRLCLMTEELQSSADIDPQEIMMLLNWVPVYNSEVSVCLGVDVSTLGQQLLGCGEDELRSHYLRVMTSKLTDWCNNLVRIEAEKWFMPPSEEDEPPDLVEGMYMTDAPVILFQMIDQQVDVAFQPGGGSEFASALLRHCFTTLKTFHAEYIANLMKVEAVLKNGQEQATHLPEFLMAAVNNNAKARVYISQVQAKIEEHLEAEIQVNEAEVMQELKRISQGFHRVSSMAVELLVELVFADLADACLQLYNQKWMRANTAIETIFATLNDYGGDFEEHVTPAYYTAIMSKCRTELLVAYIQAMLKKKLNVRSEDDREVFISRLEEETNLIRTAFEKYGVAEDEEGNDPTMVLVYIRQLMEANRSMIAVGWQKLKVEYPDVTLHHLEAILTIREDFQTKEARQYIRQLVKKEARMDDSSGDEEGGISVLARGVDFFRRISVNTSANYKRDDGKD